MMRAQPDTRPRLRVLYSPVAFGPTNRTLPTHLSRLPAPLISEYAASAISRSSCTASPRRARSALLPKRHRRHNDPTPVRHLRITWTNAIIQPHRPATRDKCVEPRSAGRPASGYRRLSTVLLEACSVTLLIAYAASPLARSQAAPRCRRGRVPRQTSISLELIPLQATLSRITPS